MAAKPKKGFTQLAELIGQEPPAEFNDLSTAELARLHEIVSESLDLHEAALSSSAEDVVAQAPRPLRGTARKILGVS